MDVDLNACINGDREAWGRFVDRFSGIIYSAVARTIRRGGPAGRQEIEDPVQEVFVRLVRDDCRLLRSFDPSRASLTTWLTVIARSVAIDQMRKRRSDPLPLEHVDPAVTPPQPVAPAAPEPPLHLLTARQRLVLRLLFEEDLTVAEAAAMLEVNEQTVRSTKHKALSRLREAMSIG